MKVRNPHPQPFSQCRDDVPVATERSESRVRQLTDALWAEVADVSVSRSTELRPKPTDDGTARRRGRAPFSLPGRGTCVQYLRNEAFTAESEVETVSEDVTYGQEVIRAEARALSALVGRLDESFAQAVELILACHGRVVTTGIGKAGIVGQKVSATLASTGTPSLPLHPVEAFHGDLGRIVKDDVVLAISNSGETAEIVQLVPELKKIGARIIAITGSRESALARHADVVLNLGHIEEACPLGLAPSCSTTAMLALGDALALAVSKRRHLSKEDFARYHPAGDLGRQLLTVEEVMRTGGNFPVVGDGTSVEEALRAIARSKDRSGSVAGSVCVVDGGGRLVGIFTDGDLRRHLESEGAGLLKRAIKEVMTPGPRLFIEAGRLAAEALRLMAENQIDDLPVVDDEFHPLGNIDIQDLLGVGWCFPPSRSVPAGRTRRKSHDRRS